MKIGLWKLLETLPCLQSVFSVERKVIFDCLIALMPTVENWIMCGCFATTCDAEQKDLVILTETAPRQSRHRHRLDPDKVDADTD